MAVGKIVEDADAVGLIGFVQKVLRLMTNGNFSRNLVDPSSA